MREPENKTSRTAKETVTYTVGKVEGDTVAIGKKYEFVTDEKNGDEPALREAGEGAIVFDTKAGLVKGIEEKLKITINDGNVTVKIPVTVSVKLMAKEEGEKALADRKAAWEALAAKARADREAAERPVLLDDAAIVRALADMKSQNEGVRKGGVERLAKAVLVERRQADVCKGLAAVLENEKDHWTIAPAVKALGIWGTKESVPALLKVLDGEDGFSRGDVIALLGKIGDASAAPAVAGWMGDMGLRGQVSAALKAMGSKAEDATLPLLKDHDMWVRSEACKVLGEIGTAKSVAALEALRDKEHGGGEAGKALDAIETRKNAPVKGVGTKAHGA